MKIGIYRDPWDAFFYGNLDILNRAMMAHLDKELYDPQKYELKPKKDYVEKLIKEKDEEIAYHEEKIRVLREQKERLSKQE